MPSRKLHKEISEKAFNQFPKSLYLISVISLSDFSRLYRCFQPLVYRHQVPIGNMLVYNNL